MTMNFLEGTAGLSGLFLSAFISSTIAPGGSEVVLAYLVDRGENDRGLLLATATIGNTLGALTTWLLGLWAASAYSLDKLRTERQRKAVASVRRFGAPILLLSWLPVVGDAFCFAAGWLRMSFPVSVLAITLGKLARYAAIVYFFS